MKPANSKNYTMLWVVVLITSNIIAQNNQQIIDLSEAELLMLNKFEQGSIHPDYHPHENIKAVPITSFPYFQDFNGDWPAEFEDVSGIHADAYLEKEYGFLGKTYFSEGFTSEGWGSTPNNYSMAFSPSKSSHFGTTQINVVPSGAIGTLTMEFMFAQGYSFDYNYSWFRVLVNDQVIYDDQGKYYWQPSNHYYGPWNYTKKTFDLSAFSGAPFQISLQSSCKYYKNYYAEGDWAAIDNFKIYYHVDEGDLEGYVFDGAGLTISGASVGVDGLGVTTTKQSGYYYLSNITGGEQEVNSWKEGYNLTTDTVYIPPSGTGYHDITLTAPIMTVSPGSHNRTMNPGEYTTEPLTKVMNTGDGPLNWEVEVVFPDTDIKVTKEKPRTNIDPNIDASPTIQEFQITNPNRNTWDVQFSFPLAFGNGEAGVESDGLYIFSTKWNGSTFYKYRRDGTYVESFSIDGICCIRDLAYVPATRLFYGSPATTDCYAMDFYSHEVVEVISTPGEIRAIAYNDDNDSFYTNNWGSDIYEWDRSTGAMINSFPAGPFDSYYGFAYDYWSDGGPYLWGFAQIGPGWGSASLVQKDAATGAETGFILDVLPLVHGTQFAGGLFTHPGIDPGFVTIGGMLQNELIFGLELNEGYVPCAWLTLDHYEGMLNPGGGPEYIETNFNAYGTCSGETYTAAMVFTSDPDVGTITIPCTMNIQGDTLFPPDWLLVILEDPFEGVFKLSWQGQYNPALFQHFIIKRDGEVVGIVEYMLHSEFFDTVPGFGNYCYTVQTQYSVGLSTPTDPHCEEWLLPELNIISTLPLELWMWPGRGSVPFTFENTGPGQLSYRFSFDGHHQVEMFDDEGYGWCDGYVKLFINGMLRDIITMSDGSGPEYVSFLANEGDEITTEFFCGCFCNNCSYNILDCNGNVIASDGVGGANPTGIGPGQCYGNCPVIHIIESIYDYPRWVHRPLWENEERTINVIYNANNFPAGDYQDDFVLITNDPNNPEVTIPNIIHVYTPGELSGIVTDCNNGFGIPGVNITAGTWQGSTSDNGSYSFYVDAGTYDVTFEKLGYQGYTEPDVVSIAGTPSIINIALCEEPYSPALVEADPSQDDTYCDIRWAPAAGPYEIQYDDGSDEDLHLWSDPGSQSAVMFTPAGYPATVVGGRLYTGNGGIPQGNWINSEFDIIVYDDDGGTPLDPFPGTVLDHISVVVNNYGWVEFWGLNSTIAEGNFFISMEQTDYSYDMNAPLGVDMTNPTYYRSYTKFQSNEWMFSPYHDFMIRAYVEGPITDDTKDETSEVKEAGNRINESPPSTKGVVSYEIARINNFDPDVGPQSGTLTSIATGEPGYLYTDNAWGSMPSGWYAYAARALYTNGDLSPWKYSNIVSHFYNVAVTFEVSICDGSDPEDVELTLEGDDYPYNTYLGVTDGTGIYTFDSVITGYYSLSAYKIGYEIFNSQDYINDDITYPVTLCEKHFPPENLWVDALTSWAYWDWPVVIVLEEHFEALNFPPDGWQSWSNELGWYPTGDGSSSNWSIPAWNSSYACSNDDAFGSAAGDGCCDYLVTPGLDLRESDDFALYFDSYYDNAYGQLAFIEYSYDEGNSWEVCHTMTPVPGEWTRTVVDLSAFSGMNAQSPVWIAFHSDDNGLHASGWAIDNVTIANGFSNPIEFSLYLDGLFVASSDTNSYQFANLEYGVTYEASVAALYCCDFSEMSYYTFTSAYLAPPRNLNGVISDDSVHIWWEPPLIPATFEMISEKPRTEFPIPNVEYSPMVQMVQSGKNPSSRDLWDVTFNFPQGSVSGESGVETDGNYIYTTKWNAGNGTFYKYQLDGTFLGPFIIDGCQDVRDLAYDPTTGLMFGSNATNTVWGMNFETQTVYMTINAPTACRAIAYDEDADGFWANDWDTPITLFDKNGAQIDVINVGAFGGLYGLAYDGWADDGPYLWAFSQAGSSAELVQYDIEAGIEIFNLNVLPIVGGTMFAGGLFTHCNMFGNNVVTIGGNLQSELLFGLEWVACSGGGPTPGVVPENLLGYNVYRNYDVIIYLPYIEEDTSHYFDPDLNPSTYYYDVSALYDLAPYGFPGDTGESALEGTYEAIIQYGHPLPFSEPWNSGGFDLNLWQHGNNWIVSDQQGNPEPSSEFTYDPVLTNYRSVLNSYPLDGKNIQDPWIDGNIWLDYDLRLDGNNNTGNEILRVRVGSEGNHKTLAEYNNANGSFGWTSCHHNITDIAFGHIFTIRFIAMGTNSADITSWFIDNIRVYRTCAGVRNFEANPATSWQNCLDVYLTWNSPIACGSVRNNSEQNFVYGIPKVKTGSNSAIRDLSGYRIFRDGNEIAFTGDTIYTDVVPDNGYYIYEVTAVYEDCESDTVAMDDAEVGCVGIHELLIDGIGVYPNPAKGILHIVSVEDITFVSITNNVGQLVYSNKVVNDNLLIINTSAFEAGVYLIKIETTEEVITRKVLIAQ